MKQQLEELFQALKGIIPIQEIGYHEIKDGKLNPIHKTITQLSIEDWKNNHLNNPVYLKDNPLLIETMEKKKAIAISDTHSDERSSKAFGLFGIDSILIIPAIHKDLVKGFVVVPCIGQYYDFSPEEVKKCEEKVSSFIKYLYD